MSLILSVTLLTAATAVACAVPGIFVVIRRQSMVTDAISHSVLPGIVVMAMLTGSITSPWLVVGAAASGVVVVGLIELLRHTRLLAGDAPIGLVFPAMFAIGVLLITANYSGVHFHVETVLVGDLNLVAMDEIIAGDYSFGPRWLWVMLGVGALSSLVLWLLRKELLLASFDRAFAAQSGFRPWIVDSVFVVILALTVTAAFNAAGAILVVAFLVVPAATARLLTGRLRALIPLTLIIAVICSLAGVLTAYVTDSATAAATATFYGVVFLFAFIVLDVFPGRSRIAGWARLLVRSSSRVRAGLRPGPRTPAPAAAPQSASCADEPTAPQQPPAPADASTAPAARRRIRGRQVLHPADRESLRRP